MTSVDCLTVMLGPISHNGGPAAAGVFVIAHHARPMDRARARLHSRRLDSALGSGASPEASPALALRARRLTALRHRRRIADSYRRVVREAREGGCLSRNRVTPSRARVSAAGDELNRLADALARPGPVAARGVAQALLLLEDGTGPLYNLRSRVSLREYAARAIDNLALDSP